MTRTASFRHHLLRRLAAASGIGVAALLMTTLTGCDDGVECFEHQEAVCPARQDAQWRFDLDCGEWVKSVDSDGVRTSEECCYEVTIEESNSNCCGWDPFEECSPPVSEGRPLRVAGRPLKAKAVSGRSWADASKPGVRGLDETQRAALATAWTRAALDEHASIASFSRFALELMALGAPSELLEEAHRAALDEVRHARDSFALASAFAGEPIAPSALALPAALPIEQDLCAFAVATAMDACVNETLAVLVASEARAHTTDAAVGAVLDTVIEEEARHAELAWRTLRWAIDEGGDPVRQAVADAVRSFDPRPKLATAAVAVPSHGLLDAKSRAEAFRRGWREVVAPCMRSLLEVA